MHCTWRDFKRRGKRTRLRPQENPKRRPSPFWYIIVLNGSLKHTASLSNPTLRYDSEQQAVRLSGHEISNLSKSNRISDLTLNVSFLMWPLSTYKKAILPTHPAYKEEVRASFLCSTFAGNTQRILQQFAAHRRVESISRKLSPRSLSTDVSTSFY